jgi:hypothetical protein
VDTWKTEPLGFALVDETEPGTLAVHHVSVSTEGIGPTGAWLLPNPDPGTVRSLLTHRVIEGTSDGVILAQALIQEPIAPARLASLVEACERSEAELTAAWLAYRDEQPARRAKLVPLKAPTWPDFTEDGDAATILQRVGKWPYPPGTPAEMRDVMAVSALVTYVLEAWHELETERIARAFLHGGNTERHLYPPEWAAAHPPYWPKAA